VTPILQALLHCNYLLWKVSVTTSATYYLVQVPLYLTVIILEYLSGLLIYLWKSVSAVIKLIYVYL
jgi:hypothetical protein